MIIPSFRSTWKDGRSCAPRIYGLEISDPGKPDTAPIECLLIEREESYRYDERDKSVYEAKIELFFALPEPKHAKGMPQRCSFSASFHAAGYDGPTVSLTSHSLSNGAVFLDPPWLRGHRVGTYLMNEIVLWARQWPDATVKPVNLLEGQAEDENRARRNRFYEQFGLVFDYKDQADREGVSRPMPVRELTPVETWKKNIRVLKLDEFIGDLLAERSDLSWKVKNSQSAIRDLLDERRHAEDRPVRWMLQVLWSRQAGSVAFAGVIVGFGLLAWWRWQV